MNMLWSHTLVHHGSSMTRMPRYTQNSTNTNSDNRCSQTGAALLEPSPLSSAARSTGGPGFGKSCGSPDIKLPEPKVAGASRCCLFTPHDGTATTLGAPRPDSRTWAFHHPTKARHFDRRCGVPGECTRWGASEAQWRDPLYFAQARTWSLIPKFRVPRPLRRLRWVGCKASPLTYATVNTCPRLPRDALSDSPPAPWPVRSGAAASSS